MKTYEVELKRTSYIIITVEAENETDVPLSALIVRSAGDYHFPKGKVQGDMSNEKATLVACRHDEGCCACCG